MGHLEFDAQVAHWLYVAEACLSLDLDGPALYAQESNPLSICARPALTPQYSREGSTWTTPRLAHPATLRLLRFLGPLCLSGK
jgi:hypothetical protein